jgi:hypothetical protein
MLESGTKTAPGIEFSFGLLADKDPAFSRGAQLSVDFLNRFYIGDKNLIMYGPNAAQHATSNPPCLYSTFARAQSLATAVEYAPDAAAPGTMPSEAADWRQYFPSAKTGLVRTAKLMATVTAYDGIGQYSRAEVARGGSITNLWFEGYGKLGFLLTSSQSTYTREEAMHMPTEGALLPLTERIERTGPPWYANLFDEKAILALAADGAGTKATSTGALKDANGASSGVTFTWIHRFAAESWTGEVTVSSAQGVRIVEPFVDLPGNVYALAGDSVFRITVADGSQYELKVTSSSGPFTLASGEDKAKYWSPFPGLQCHPLAIKLGGTGTQTVAYAITRPKSVAVRAVSSELRKGEDGIRVRADGARAERRRGTPAWSVPARSH